MVAAKALMVGFRVDVLVSPKEVAPIAGVDGIFAATLQEAVRNTSYHHFNDGKGISREQEDVHRIDRVMYETATTADDSG